MVVEVVMNGKVLGRTSVVTEPPATARGLGGPKMLRTLSPTNIVG